MRMNLVVKEVRQRPGSSVATLHPVDWFKVNPADEGDEFLEAAPFEDGAECAEIGIPIDLDVTGMGVSPGDNIALTAEVLPAVSR